VSPGTRHRLPTTRSPSPSPSFARPRYPAPEAIRQVQILAGQLRSTANPSPRKSDLSAAESRAEASTISSFIGKCHSVRHALSETKDFLRHYVHARTSSDVY
jgi:hypothetical protein